MTRTQVILAIIVAFTLGLLSFTNDASATTITLDGTSCLAYGGTWDAGTSTCTIGTAGNVIAASDDLVISSGTTLVIENTVGTGLQIDGMLTNSGTLTNDGTITVSNTGGTGIRNTRGTLTNSGTLTISAGTINHQAGTFINSGTIAVFNTGSINITHFVTLTNDGTITVSNTDGTGIVNNGIIINSAGAQIQVSNSAGIGIENIGIDDVTHGGRQVGIFNSGTITVSNTDGTGIDNYHTFFNSGTIVVSSTDGYDVGINNRAATLTNSGDIRHSGTLTNDGTITVSNTGGTNNLTPSGILNDGTVSNNGMITILNTGESNGILSYGTIINSAGAQIQVSNSSGYGILNESLITVFATFTNSGILIVSNTGGVGIVNTSTFINSAGAQIQITNSDSVGISNSDTLSNSGTITISNSGLSTGIGNIDTITNSGTITITISNSSPESAGIYNYTDFFGIKSGTLINSAGAQIQISNSNGYGIYIQVGTLTNDGTITVSNTGGTGIYINSNGTLTNSGTITVSNTGGTGITGPGTISNSGILKAECGSGSAQFFTGGAQLTISCGSIIVEVQGGMIEAIFVAADGRVSTTTIDAGNGLTFNPNTSTFTAPETNQDTIVIIADGQNFSLDPGADITIGIYCGKTIDKFTKVIDGTPNDDILTGSNGSDLIRGFGGMDTIKGGNGDDCIMGGDGNDILHGENGIDMIEGNLGTDTIFGGNGNDNLYGGGGNDDINGEKGDDTIDGGSDNDICRGGSGKNIMNSCFP